MPIHSLISFPISSGWNGFAGPPSYTYIPSVSPAATLNITPIQGQLPVSVGVPFGFQYGGVLHVGAVIDIDARGPLIGNSTSQASANVTIGFPHVNGPADVLINEVPPSLPVSIPISAFPAPGSNFFADAETFANQWAQQGSPYMQNSEQAIYASTWFDQTLASLAPTIKDVAGVTAEIFSAGEREYAAMELALGGLRESEVLQESRLELAGFTLGLANTFVMGSSTYAQMVHQLNTYIGLASELVLGNEAAFTMGALSVYSGFNARLFQEVATDPPTPITT